MIKVTRLKGRQVYINPEFIRFIEETPDTVITFMDQSKLVVVEPSEVVAERFIEYQRKVHHAPQASLTDNPNSNSAARDE